MITRQTVVDKITDYLRHHIALAELVDWSENAMCDDQFAANDTELLASVLSRLGVADAQNFELTWDILEGLLRELGYAVRVEVSMK